MNRLLLTLGILCALAVGCANPEQTAYRVIGTTIVSVDAAMNGWGDYVRAGKATPEEQMSVRTAYEKYQNAKRAAQAGIMAYKVNPDRATLDIVLDALDASRIELMALIQGLQQ